jgi:CDP-diacylglycerol--glycerol-3-phosphate 3-phosphatidyltransferase
MEKGFCSPYTHIVLLSFVFSGARVINQPAMTSFSKWWGVPNLLSLVRAGLVPVLLYLAWAGHGRLFLVVLLFCYTTDILDGYLARILGRITDFGSLLDSTADRLVYISIPISAYWLRPDVYELEPLSIIVLLICFIVPIVISYAKFRQMTSYHTVSSKISAVVFALSVIIVFAGGPSFPLRIVAIVFALSALQDIAITISLPRPVANVRSILHAREIAAASSLQKKPAV